MLKFFLLLSLSIFLNFYSMIAQAKITILAAENVYGSVCQEIGGEFVHVISVLNNPTQDPHLFSIAPSTAKAAASADIIIFNGGNYDPWIKNLLTKKKNVTVIEIAKIIGNRKGDNPHYWYNPDTMPIVAEKITQVLSELDPAQQKFFRQQLLNFKSHYQIILLLIKNLKAKFNNVPVIATEPIFGYMAKSIGLKMYGEEFQLSMMNDIPPSPSQIKNFEDLIRKHLVLVFIYNKQVINPLTKRLLILAKKEDIPTVGFSEMMPTDMTFVTWMEKQLTDLQNALQMSLSHAA